MSKIICRIYGWLGNQLFQINALLNLKIHSEKNINYFLDLSGLNDYEIGRDYEVNKLFNFDFKKTNSIINKLRLAKIFKLKTKLITFVNDLNYVNLSQKKINSHNIYLDGYFQNIPSIESESIMLLKKKFLGNSKIQCDAIIHIRGSDFLTNKKYKFDVNKYYKNALSELSKHYKNKNIHVITDDNNYSISILDKIQSDYKFIYTSMNLVDDFSMIVNANFKIISTSTFSFWAALMGEDKSNLIIAPKTWFNGERRIYKLKNELNV